jgi:hypothetical protein
MDVGLGKCECEYQRRMGGRTSGNSPLWNTIKRHVFPVRNASRSILSPPSTGTYRKRRRRQSPTFFVIPQPLCRVDTSV